MQYRTLGDSSLSVSEVSLGCWTMGGPNWVNGHDAGWSKVDLDEIRAAIKTGVDAGINHFDNADVYGNGSAERLLASCLKALGLKSEDFVIASKVGYIKGDAPHPYDPAQIRKQCEESLANLGRDYIDIYYLHHGDFGPDDSYLEGAAETLHRLKDEGKIRLIGQSAYKSSRFETIVPVLQPTVLQSWAHAMDTRFIKPSGIVGQLLSKCRLSFIAFSPLNQGLLLDKFSPQSPPRFEKGDHRRNSSKFSPASLEALAPKLDALKERFGASADALASVSLRYVLNHPQVACVIPGFRNSEQVAGNLHAVDRTLDSEEMDFIQSLFEKR